MRRFGWIACLAVALLGPAAGAQACSECMCGTPFPADALGGVVPMQFRWGFEDRYLSKSNGLDDGPGVEQEREHRVAAFGLWRARNRLALLVKAPYNVKELHETPLGEPTDTRTSRGFGDAEATALIGLLHTNGAHAATLGAVLGVIAPTGSNSARNGVGELLDQHLQPGSGAWAGTGGVHLSAAMGRGLVDASVLGRLNGTSGRGYRYGRTLLYNLGYTSPSLNGWQLLAQLNGRSSAHDRNEDGTQGANTGGSVLYLAPGARWTSGIGMGVEAGVQVPVARALYGVQTEHVTAHLAVSVSH